MSSDPTRVIGGDAPTAQEKHDLDSHFTYHAPKPEQIPKYQAIRDKAKELAMVLLVNAPDCPDRSAAMRKLRECVMTANAAIAINT